KVSLPALTGKDLQDVALGLELEVDFIALSFVREAKDIRQLKAVVANAKHKPLIIAKIEDQQAVTNLKEIIQESDALMIARGDLGIEVPYEELPIIQRRSVKYCLRIGKPVIVATHMLESMIENPIPTRAEVTDVANAVYEQADAIMLSGETTVGKYPLKCLEVMNRVAERIERSGGANFQEHAELTNQREKLVKSAVVMADELQAAAILVFTLSGTSARYASWMRPRHSPIYAICDTQAVADSLTLNWGVRPIVFSFDHRNREKTISHAIGKLVDQKLLGKGNTVVVISSIDVDGQIVQAVQMRDV
ncbi:MAG: pyruvate kinase, partial [Verrucomicrobiota bacterium]